MKIKLHDKKFFIVQIHKMGKSYRLYCQMSYVRVITEKFSNNFFIKKLFLFLLLKL